MWTRAIRAVISLATSIVPLLYFGGYLTFLGLKSPYSVSNISSLFTGAAANSTSSASSLGMLGALGGSSAYLPLGATGITFLLIFTILSRVGSMGMSMASSPRMPNMSQLGNMPFFPGMQQQGSVPENLPQDITKTQFIILRQFRNNSAKAKDIAKSLSMDRKDVEAHISTLKSNGYLTNKGKLTSKAMELLP